MKKAIRLPKKSLVANGFVFDKGMDAFDWKAGDVLGIRCFTSVEGTFLKGVHAQMGDQM